MILDSYGQAYQLRAGRLAAGVFPVEVFAPEGTENMPNTYADILAMMKKTYRDVGDALRTNGVIKINPRNVDRTIGAFEYVYNDLSKNKRGDADWLPTHEPFSGVFGICQRRAKELELYPNAKKFVDQKIVQKAIQIYADVSKEISGFEVQEINPADVDYALDILEGIYDAIMSGEQVDDFTLKGFESSLSIAERFLDHKRGRIHGRVNVNPKPPGPWIVIPEEYHS